MGKRTREEHIQNFDINEKKKFKKRKEENEKYKKYEYSLFYEEKKKIKYERDEYALFYEAKEDMIELFKFYYLYKPLLIEEIDNKIYNSRFRNIKRYTFQDMIDKLREFLYPKKGIDMLFDYDFSKLIKNSRTLFIIKHENMQYKLLNKITMNKFLVYIQTIDLLANRLAL